MKNGKIESVSIAKPEKVNWLHRRKEQIKE